MRRFRKSVLTVAISVFILAAFTILITASDFDVSKAYFTSSGQAEAFFEAKVADS